MQDEKEHVKQKLIDNGYVGNAKTLKKNIHVELQSMWKEIKDKNPDVYKKYKSMEEAIPSIVQENGMKDASTNTD